MRVREFELLARKSRAQNRVQCARVTEHPRLRFFDGDGSNQTPPAVIEQVAHRLEPRVDSIRPCILRLPRSIRMNNHEMTSVDMLDHRITEHIGTRSSGKRYRLRNIYGVMAFVLDKRHSESLDQRREEFVIGWALGIDADIQRTHYTKPSPFVLDRYLST